ncbi:SPOR domain-containing protein, partial [Zoogloea sp.]|uniref:SPOR domain-containing protein n=1 Tax=Zoogloea sp. TaxID=49181 RepID=UPI001AC0A9A4
IIPQIKNPLSLERGFFINDDDFRSQRHVHTPATHNTSTGKLGRLIVGPFADRREALAAQARLREKGVDSGMLLPLGR